MKIQHNSSGFYLGLRPEEALKLIRQLSEAIEHHDRQGGSGFTDAATGCVSPTQGGDGSQFPSTVHFYVEKTA